MRGAFTLLLLLVFSNTYSQLKCDAVIDWTYSGKVFIYNKPKGKVIHQLKNDSAHEDFLQLDIIGQTEDYFRVSISMYTDDPKCIPPKVGWIKKAKYVGAYVKNEEYPMNLVLYRAKEVSAKNKIVVEEWTPAFLKIEVCDNLWTFVSLIHNGVAFKGWIETKNLCANSYTFCN